MKRVVWIVMDSLGIGGAADAERFGDTGSNTLLHIAERVPVALPVLSSLGLGYACEASCGVFPPGLNAAPELRGGFAFAREISTGKDTPSGHWEMAGVPVLWEWGYFRELENSFPADLLAKIVNRAGLPGFLGNCHASGTEIIARLGEEHVASGKPIFYTSADSVFQIACHEEAFGLERLYALCERVRELLEPYTIGRVIARPFVGDNAGSFERTGNRHDYALEPPTPTVLQKLVADGGTVIGVGKIGDIYAHTGMSEELRASGHEALWTETFAALARAGDRSVVMTNFVDFDAVYGHRRDVEGYAKALQAFDARLPDLLDRLGEGDLLMITADHGNDPTWSGTDHTRENVPVLLFGEGVEAGRDYGARETLADMGQTVAGFFGLEAMAYGEALL